MTAKEILTGCRDAVLNLRKLDEQLARCLPTGKPSGVKTQQYNADPPGTNNPTAAAIQLYDGLSAQRDELAQQLETLSQSAWTLLRAIPDVRTLVILHNYYLLGQTDQEIGRAQGLSREHVNRLRRIALSSLKS